MDRDEQFEYIMRAMWDAVIKLEDEGYEPSQLIWGSAMTLARAVFCNAAEGSAAMILRSLTPYQEEYINLLTLASTKPAGSA